MLLSLLLFKIVLKVLDNAFRQENKIKFYIFDMKINAKLIYSD